MPSISAEQQAPAKHRHSLLHCLNQPGTILVMAKSSSARQSVAARTIRFPASLRDAIAADAKRCGRSFEAQVIALLRRHYGEDVDIAPSPAEIINLAAASLAGVPDSDLPLLTPRFSEND